MRKRYDITAFNALDRVSVSAFANTDEEVATVIAGMVPDLVKGWDKFSIEVEAQEVEE